jgi:putative redox protein
MREPLNISINWKEKMQFIATNDKTDFEVAIDVPYVEEGGEKKGTTPKYLFLQSIAGCTGQIVVMFLRKMKAEMPSKFSIDITGKLSSEHPMYFENIAITYNLEGNTDVNKLKKVVEMSEKQYCGLTLMVSKMANIDSKLFLNGENIEL